MSLPPWAAISLALLLSCAVTLPSRSVGDGETYFSALNRLCEDVPRVGTGTVTASTAGEKATGLIDMRYSGVQSFKAVLYSPLGATVGSLVSGDDSLELIIGKNRRVMAFSDSFAPDLLPWGRGLRCDEVIRALSGQILYCDSIGNRHPQKIIATGFRISYIWEIGPWRIIAVFSRMNKRLRYVELHKSTNGNDDYTIRFDSISASGARIIAMKADDRNYFSVEFERLRKN